MHTNTMIPQIESLPALIRESDPRFFETIKSVFDQSLCRSINRLYLLGCGDSHHAALGAEMAFEAIAGIPTEPITSLQFSRYAVDFLPGSVPGNNLVIGISVSGEVARTIEALNLAKEAGATTIALTGTPGSRLAEGAQQTLNANITPFPDPPGTHTPGIRSFATNQIILYLLAIHIGQTRGTLTEDEAGILKHKLLHIAYLIQQSMPVWKQTARELVKTWATAQEFVFLGGGPNYSTALFSAAKILEASGDPALGQDMEEWAHLQYFARNPDTPTILISPCARGFSRSLEVGTAARTLGRRVAAVTSQESHQLADIAEFTFKIRDRVNECFSPLIAAVPGEMIAAYRAEQLDEPYFRAFGGGRDQEGGGGISRIRTSEVLRKNAPENNTGR
jgi:glucosamine--fructose-6-phosphate aminotransferase (isomerizing)